VHYNVKNNNRGGATPGEKGQADAFCLLYTMLNLRKGA
jgi:hypothetical protein